MRGPWWGRGAGWSAGLVLLLGGCTTPPAGGDAPGAPGDVVSRWQAWGGRKAGPEQAPPPPSPREAGMSEQIALVSEKLHASDDDRKVLTARLQMLEGQLTEKDRALAQAAREVEEATARVARTRRELRAWRQEMEGLRDRMGGMEKENKATLESIIHTLEQILEHEREPALGPGGSPGPDLLRVP